MYATRVLRMQPTRRLFSIPKEEQAAHTVSQRLARLRNIPPELIPLGVVVAFAVGAAGYSCGRHLMYDRTLRLTRQGPRADH